MGCLNSYALLMPVPAPLPIVSIKIGYNGGQEYNGTNDNNGTIGSVQTIELANRKMRTMGKRFR